MHRHLALAALAACTASVACAPADRPELARPDRRVVASFSGAADALAGTLTLEAVSSSPGALQELPVVRDGVPGSGPPDTVELVTESAQTIAGGCGAVDGFEGRIRLRSFYAGSCLVNAYAEILEITPTGHEACNSAPAVPGVSSALGLFSYGTVARAGLAGDSAVAAWRFRVPSAVGFTFKGRIVADLVAACATPGLPGVPAPRLAGAPGGAAVADATGDGLPDLVSVTAGAGAATLEIAPGTGGGRYATPAVAALGTTYVSPVRTAFANVGGTAAPDVLYTDASGQLVVHLAQAGGGYGPATAYAAPGAGALALADLDGDGDLDAVVAGTSVNVFVNGGGTFGAAIQPMASSSGRGVAVGNVDAAGNPDVVATSGASLLYARQAATGPVSFKAATTLTVATAGADLWGVTLFNMNGDAYLDAAAANRGNSCVARFKANPPGKAFQYVDCIAVPLAPERIISADLDGNGSADLVVAGSGAVSVLLADAAAPGGYRVTTYAGPPSPAGLAVADVNGDGLPDLVVPSSGARAAAVLLNAGAGAFRAPGRLAAAAGTRLAVPVDLDRDGRPDLVVASTTGSTVTVQRNAGSGAFSAGTAIALPAAPAALAAGDLNRDGNPDVAVAVGGTGQVCVLLGNGAGALGAPACTAAGAVPAGIALLDVTGDGALDVAVSVADAAGSVRMFRNGGTGTLTRDATLDAVAIPHATGLVAVDVDGDGRADLATAGDGLAVLPNTGAGFGAPTVVSAAAGGAAIVAADLNGDGRTDLATTGPDELRVFLQGAGGTFALSAALPFPSPVAVAAADLNGDGAVDLAATSSARGGVGVFWNRGAGAWDPAQDGWVAFPAGSDPAAIVAADLDGDLRADLAVTDGAGALDVLRAACLP